MKKQTKIILNSSFLILNFIFTSCYTWFEDKINMDTSSIQASLNDFLYQAPPITALDSPVQVIASQGLYSGSIKLNWSQVENASSYRIERAVVQPDSNGLYTIPEEGDFSVIEKYVYKNVYEDKILSKPTNTNDEYNYKYYYRISAENIKMGYESSEYTDILKKETSGLGWLLPAPTNIDAWKGKSQSEILVSWDAVPNAVNYVIYRGTHQNGTGMEEIATVLGNRTSFSNSISESDQGIEYYYKVSAKLSNGSTSADSSLALGYSLKPGAPVCPENIRVVNGLGEDTTSITIAWDKVNFTPVTPSTVTYALYRTSSVDSVYTLIKNNISVDKTSETISEGLQPGIKYYFYLQTISTDDATKEKIKSSFSETGPVSNNPVVGFLLSPPSDVELLDGTSNNTVTLRWTPAVGYDLIENPYSYSIYYDDELNGEYNQVIINNISSNSLTLDSDGYYVYEDIAKHNFFKILTINNNGLESELSYAVAPTPTAPQKVVASKSSGLDGLSNYSPNTNEVYPVKITWSAPANENPAGYNVYRSTKPDSSFRKLNETPILANEKFEFIDENDTARAGTFYYYKVVSLNVLGQGKKGNDPSNGTDARGYGAITRDQWFREYNKSIMKSQSKLTLMHKAVDTDKLGSETIKGDVSGSLSYKAAIAGLGAEITMHYENYCDFTLGGNSYFVLTGNTDTTSNMSANGNMHGTVKCTGMYPGYAVYDNLQIKGGAAGGGYYLVETYDLSGKKLLSEAKVNWLVGEE